MIVTAERKRKGAGVPVRDVSGLRFGKLLVVGFSHMQSHKSMWNCKCDCGGLSIVSVSNLHTGHTTSCGCSRVEFGKTSRTHGMRHTKAYSVWTNMITRCSNPNVKCFKNYGGRGINVCERWKVFDNFIADMGTPASGMQLERIDNSKGYEPGNCKWETASRNCRNKRTNKILTHNGKSLCLSDWESEVGISARLISDRIRKGWTAKEALETPVNIQFRNQLTPL